MKPLPDALRHPEKVFIPYIVVEWGYNEKWKQISPVDDCPPEMLRNVTAALVEAGYHPFAEDEEEGEEDGQGRNSIALFKSQQTFQQTFQ